MGAHNAMLHGTGWPNRKKPTERSLNMWSTFDVLSSGGSLTGRH